jgi:hypothetical protein
LCTVTALVSLRSHYPFWHFVLVHGVAILATVRILILRSLHDSEVRVNGLAYDSTHRSPDTQTVLHT